MPLSSCTCGVQDEDPFVHDLNCPYLHNGWVSEIPIEVEVPRILRARKAVAAQYEKPAARRLPDWVIPVTLAGLLFLAWIVRILHLYKQIP